MAAARGVPDGTTEPRLEKARHIKYWTRCIKTFLPRQYTGNDSNRMYLAYFMLSALDLLDALPTVCNEDERQDYADWIYRCQHPQGGFRMYRGTDFGESANSSNAKWDPANVPATYFALSALLILGDDFKRVRRKETLQWLRKMQRSDGSFGETLVDGRIEGGRDPRFGYCAAGARYILRGGKEGTDDDIDIDALVTCIRASEAFDGGIADEPFHEPHAGYTFCSLGALNFINRLTNTSSTPAQLQGPRDVNGVIRWLVHRQTDLLDPDASLDSEFLASTKRASKLSGPEFENMAAHASDEEQPDESTPPPPILQPEILCAGMNGRANKVADTCYAWWSGASLHMLGQPALYDRAAVRRYLLEKTQHPVLGGFGKFPGDLPDLYHSYLGLAALGLAGSDEIKGLDAGMCVSEEASARLAGIWKSWD